MNKDLEVLRTIEQSEKTSQREFARILGVSLGTANAIVQKLITDGFVELIQLESKGVDYRVTDRGRLRKAELFYDEVLEAYDVIANFKKVVRDKLEALIKKGSNKFFLFGDEDDIFRLIKMALLELKRNNEIEFTKPDEIIHINDKQAVTIVWNQKVLNQFKDKNDNVVYILE